MIVFGLNFLWALLKNCQKTIPTKKAPILLKVYNRTQATFFIVRIVVLSLYIFSFNSNEEYCTLIL